MGRVERRRSKRESAGGRQPKSQQQNACGNVVTAHEQWGFLLDAPGRLIDDMPGEGNGEQLRGWSQMGRKLPLTRSYTW